MTSKGIKNGQPEGKSSGSLLFASAVIACAAATLVGAVQITARLLDRQPTRVRDLEVFLLLRSVAEAFHLDLSRRAPEFANRVHALADWPEALLYAGQAGATVIAVFAGLTLLALVVALPLRGLSVQVIPRRVGDWIWLTAFPLAIFSFLVTPLLFPLIQQRLFPGRLVYQGLALVATSISFWVILLALLRGSKWAATIKLAAVVGALGPVLTASMLALGNLSGDRTGLPTHAPGPNVLLISVDTLRPDHLGCYGYARDTSPAIDSLARDGARFETVVSSSSWTLPAHISLLSGLPSEAHGVTYDGMKAGSEVVFLSEIFQDAGYSTAGFVAGPYLSASYGFLQGFEHYDDYSVASLVNRRSHEGVTSPKSLEIAESWLRSWDRGGRRRPFFVFLHLWDVHFDFTPPPPFDSLFDPEYDGSITGENFERGAHIHRNMDARDLQHVIALYDGEIRYTDAHIGRLLQLLQELRAFDNTVIVVTADHGEEFFEHGQKGHRKSLFDETILVPLIVRFPPKVPSGVVVTQQVSLLDVAPTILSLAGLVRPDGFAMDPARVLRGADLLPVILGRASSAPNGAYSDLHGTVKAVRSATDKLVWDASRESETYLYFDLVNDPAEKNNLTDQYPERVSRARDQLSRWVEHWTKGESIAEPAEVDDELRERLRNLGYIE